MVFHYQVRYLHLTENSPDDAANDDLCCALGYYFAVLSDEKFFT